jgi:hypothetical protein
VNGQVSSQVKSQKISQLKLLSLIQGLEEQELIAGEVLALVLVQVLALVMRQGLQLKLGYLQEP